MATLARLSRFSLAFALLLGPTSCATLLCEGPPELVVDLDDAVVPATMDLRGIVRLNSAYLAVGTGGAVARLPSFSDWVAIESPTSADLLAVAHWGPRVIAVGRGGVVVQSDDDGSSFALVDLGVGEDFHAIMVAGQIGVIVGDDRILVSSDGGDSWTPASLPAGSFGLRGVASEPGQPEVVWAVGLAGAILRSDDAGASWSSVASPLDEDLWAIGYAGIDVEVGLFAVGDAGAILRRTSSGWAPVEHELEQLPDLRDVAGNYIVGADGIVIAIELEPYTNDAILRMVELDRDPARGDLWAVADDLAVGDQSRLTTIQTDWVAGDVGPFCDSDS